MRGLGEAWLTEAVLWLRLVVEAVGASVIAIGVVVALVGFLRHRDDSRNIQVRITLARYLSLALEFQLAADVLTTAVAPGWDEIGKLGATAAIRTALNYFLEREMRALQQMKSGERGHVQE